MNNLPKMLFDNIVAEQELNLQPLSHKSIALTTSLSSQTMEI